MTRARIPGPTVPRGPISVPKPPTPVADTAAASVSQAPLPQSRIDVATGRVLPDLPEPMRPRPQPRIDVATGRVLPDLPGPVRPRPQPRIDIATGRVLPDLPEPVRPRPQPRIDIATGRVLPDLPEPVRPCPQPRIDLATMRPLPDLPEPASGNTAVQLQAAPGGAANLTASAVHAAAVAGIRDGGQPLPHLDRIQRAFGPDHDVSQVTAHVGGAATAAAAQLGATAYAVGEHVAFAGEPDLRLASHEAAHVVQQRSGVHSQGGIDQPGDAFERHAVAVANAVVDGKTAATLLDPLADGGARRPSAQRTSDTGRRTVQRAPLASNAATRPVGSGSPQTSSAGRQAASDERRELFVAQVESLRLEAGGAPSVAYYSDLLAAVLAAQRLIDRTPDNPAVSARVTQLLQPAARRLDQLNDHQGRLRQFGAGNLAGQVALDMSQSAIEAWLRRLKLGAPIHTDEFVTKFRAGAETIRFLTGERTDAPTLRAFDTASRVTALGAAGLALAPVMLAVAAEAAPLLVNAAGIATQRVVLWALHNPAAALAASEALLGLGLQLGEEGLGTFWDLLHDPTGRWFILAQVLMDYVHIRSGMRGGGTTDPSSRRSSVPSGTELPPSRVPAQAVAGALPDLGSGAAPEVAGARERVTQLRTIVQRVHDEVSATRETDQAAGPRSPHSYEEHSPIAISADEQHGAARRDSVHTGAAESAGSVAKIPEGRPNATSHPRLAAAASRAGISVRSLSTQQQELLSSADSLIAKGDIHGALKLFDQLSNSGVPQETIAKLESEIATLHSKTPPGIYRQPRATLPNGKIIEPSAYGGRIFYGTNETPEIVFEQGFSARGSKTDLLSHVLQDPESAFRGTTRQIFEPRSPGEDQAGAGAWAGEGGYVYEIDGTPSWDLNAQLAGRVSRPDGSFGGNPLYGEHEYAILANVPRQRIVGAYPIRMQNGRLAPGPLIRNTHHKPVK